MKKIVLWFATTFSIVVLLFGYRTSTNTTTASAASSAVSPYTGTAATPTSATPSTATPSTAAPSTAAATSSSGNAITAPSATSSTTGSTSSSTSTSSSAAAAPTTTTYTGDSASTRWGDVQVAITVTDGKITAVNVPLYPTGNGKDQQINARALPILVRETISNQSANIDMVSGATVTSEGYLQSLQSALDQAGL